MEKNGTFLSLRLSAILPKSQFRSLTASYQHNCIVLSGVSDMGGVLKAMIADSDLTQRHWIIQDGKHIRLEFKEWQP